MTCSQNIRLLLRPFYKREDSDVAIVRRKVLVCAKTGFGGCHGEGVNMCSYLELGGVSCVKLMNKIRNFNV
jgi:hypothetical protein